MGEGSTEFPLPWVRQLDAGSLGLRSPVRTTAVGSPLTVTPRLPRCPSCARIMRFVRATSRFEGYPTFISLNAEVVV